MEYSERTNSQGHDRYDRHDSFPDLVLGHAMNATAWSHGMEANRSFPTRGLFMTGSSSLFMEPGLVALGGQASPPSTAVNSSRMGQNS